MKVAAAARVVDCAELSHVVVFPSAGWNILLAVATLLFISFHRT